MRRMRRAPTTAAAITLAAVCSLCGCGLREGLSLEATGVATDATEAEPMLAIGVGLATLPALAIPASATTLADAVAAQTVLADLLPNGSCLTVETEGNVVTYVFDECTGPWGLVTVSGREVATFAPVGAGSFEIGLQSEDLTVNGTPATHEGTALVVVTDVSRTVSWSGSYDGKTLLGRNVQHDAELSIVLETTGAVSIDGSTSTSIGIRGLDIDLQQLSRPGPAGTCPTGTLIATTKLTMLELTITFDGTATAFVEGNRGGHDNFAITCSPAAAD